MIHIGGNFIFLVNAEFVVSGKDHYGPFTVTLSGFVRSLTCSQCPSGYVSHGSPSTDCRLLQPLSYSQVRSRTTRCRFITHSLARCSAVVPLSLFQHMVPICSIVFLFCWPCISVQFLLITNFTHFSNLFIYLFHFSACFEQPSAHHQENKLYQYIILCISTCVGDCLVWPSPGPAYQLPTQSDTYQTTYWYNLFSWWWALGCSKHAEKWNKYIEKVRQVGY